MSAPQTSGLTKSARRPSFFFKIVYLITQHNA